MDDRDFSPSRRPGGPGPDEARAVTRDRGLRHVRRLSNWTAFALIAAAGATAGYFAHATASAPRPAAVSSVQSQPPGSHQPCVTAPVAASGGSGVTTPTAPSSCATGQNGTSAPAARTLSYEGRDD